MQSNQFNLQFKEEFKALKHLKLNIMFLLGNIVINLSDQVAKF